MRISVRHLISLGGALSVLSLPAVADGADNQRVFMSERDATVPTISSLSAPSGPDVGVDVAMSAAAARPASQALDTTPPLITRLRVTHARFRVGTRSTALIAATLGRKRATPTGTTFTFDLSERANVVLAIAGRVPGREAGTRCVPGGRQGGRCEVIVSLGPILRANKGPGNVSIPFSGRVGATRLTPGSYAAGIGAVDAAGNVSRIRIVRFTVVGR